MRTAIPNANPDPEALWGVRRNDMVGKPVRGTDPDEHKVRKHYRELRKWCRRDFRDNPEFWPELVRADLRWEVVD